MRERLLGLLDGGAKQVRAHAFWIEVCGAAAVVVVVAALAGRAALGRAAVLDAEAARLERILGDIDLWRAEFRTATAAESAQWRQSERDVRWLTVGAREQAALLHLLARRAEELGIAVERPTVEDADSLAVFGPWAVDAWSVEQGHAALGVVIEADYPAVLGYIGALPPQVSIRRLRLERGSAGVRAYVLLTTFQVVGGEGAHGAATRADAVDRGVRRPVRASGALARGAADGDASRRGALAGSGRTRGARSVPGRARTAGAAGG